MDLTALPQNSDNPQSKSESKNPYDYLYGDREAKDKYPSALLQSSIEMRLDYFDKKMISHAKLLNVTNDLLNFIHHPISQFALVIGPARIGKTTLYSRIVRSILSENNDKMEADKGFIPISGIELNPLRK